MHLRDKINYYNLYSYYKKFNHIYYVIILEFIFIVLFLFLYFNFLC
jgi:hypothetical protein